VDELRWNVEIDETLDRFTRSWAGNDVAPDDNAVHVDLTNLLEYGLECGEVGMNVVDGSDAHDGIPFIGRCEARIQKNSASVATALQISKGKSYETAQLKANLQTVLP
jgi:hypothetical protein